MYSVKNDKLHSNRNEVTNATLVYCYLGLAAQIIAEKGLLPTNNDQQTEKDRKLCYGPKEGFSAQNGNFCVRAESEIDANQKYKFYDSL